ncbi:hypothetical protein O181_003131 [Austropuccinia psidii MF-1]|uniref:Uncharacterized protein n=1 Tax=Austropuccinia psidii MF-1 TaxID=1389203 RepID=A0A9Q3BEB6_9BASI|nr:hypothetical protein [Austropuccinia psidii MF-1]
MNTLKIIKVISTTTTQVVLTNQQLSGIFCLEESNQCSHGRSQPGKHGNHFRDHVRGAQRLYKDYFSEDPIYNNQIFKQRFIMQQPLFPKSVSALENQYPYFKQAKNAAGKGGLTGLQKITTAIQQLSNGVSADQVDEYLQFSE